ncbi:hypothetical protein E2562_031773, partial [Oryza meyeriana var. granulata]
RTASIHHLLSHNNTNIANVSLAARCIDNSVNPLKELDLCSPQAPMKPVWLFYSFPRLNGPNKSNVVSSNTFGGNTTKYEPSRLNSPEKPNVANGNTFGGMKQMLAFFLCAPRCQKSLPLDHLG